MRIFSLSFEQRPVIRFCLAAVSVVVFCAAVCAAAYCIAEDGRGERSIELFVKKCSACHTWKRAVMRFPGTDAESRAATIDRMWQKKPELMTAEEADAIKLLLAEGDLEDVSAAAAVIGKTETGGQPEEEAAEVGATDSGEAGEAREAIEELMKMGHGIYMSLIFLWLGVYMLMTGLKRYFMGKKKYKNFPVKFKWKDHVKWGKVYVAMLLLGYLGGLGIWAFDGFDFGSALPHFAVGSACAALLLAGGLLIGLKLNRGKAPEGLKKLHMVLVILGTLAFVFNIVSGIMFIAG
ncbi:MAG TPA: hypothetical protein PLN69_01985 [bacterium]|nr:hypothetical protein [bacterium]